MPRRHRPPASAREIGAYLCGSRLFRTWAAENPDDPICLIPSRARLAERLATEDAELMASMDETDWWYYFDRGFEGYTW